MGGHSPKVVIIHGHSIKTRQSFGNSEVNKGTESTHTSSKTLPMVLACYTPEYVSIFRKYYSFCWIHSPYFCLFRDRKITFAVF